MPGNNKKREIRVFISSTFSDMQKERDSLVQTFNFLRTEASKRGVSVTMVDLRWGITETEAAQGRIIDICLKEIDNARPFFIGIVGNNYGSIPPPGLAGNAELARAYPGVVRDIESGKSYTEIEMQYGVLGNPEDVDAFFYIKEGGQDDPRNADKLEALKSRIRQQERYPVYPYTTPGEIAGQVRSDFMRILDERFPEEPLTIDDEIRRRQAVYRDNLLDFYIERPALQDEAVSAIMDGKGSLVHVSGPSGSGKSALCAWLVREFSSRDGCRASSFFAGFGSSDEDLTEVASYLTGDSVGYENAEQVIRDAVSTDNRRRVIVLDGLDAMESEPIRQHGATWLSVLPNNYKVVVSSTEGSPLNALISSLEGVSTVACPPLEEGEKSGFAVSYLERFGKKLAPAQLDRVVRAPVTGNPAILRSLLDELTAFGYFERLDERIDEYTGKKDGDEFFRSVLSRIEQDFGSHGPESVFRALALSRHGLTEYEIERICGIRRIDLSILLGNCPSLIGIVSGTVCITNSRIREIIRERYSDEAADERMRLRICDDFLRRCKDYSISFHQFDPFRKSFLYDDTARIVHEAAFQLYHLHDWPALYGFLIRPSIFEVLFRTDRFLLQDCWKALEAEGYALESMLDREEIQRVDKYLKPVIYTDLGRFALSDMEQADLSRRAYGLCMKAYDEGFPAGPMRPMMQAATLSNQAIVAYESGDFEQALRLFEEALKLTLSVPSFGPGSKEVASGYANLARIHKAMEHYGEAIPYFKDALNSLRILHEGPHADTADLLCGMAFCLYRTDDDAGAIEAYSEAYGMYCALEGKDSGNAVRAQFGKARSRYFTTSWIDALDDLNDALEKSIRTNGEKDQTTRSIYEMLGRFWERFYKEFHERVSLERRREYVEQAAICFAHADNQKDAQRMVDLYNSL